MNKLSMETDYKLFLSLLELAETFVFKDDKAASELDTLTNSSYGQKLVACSKGLYIPDEADLTIFSASIADGSTKKVMTQVSKYDSADDISLYYVEYKKNIFYSMQKYYNIVNDLLSGTAVSDGVLQETVKRAIWKGYKIYTVGSYGGENILSELSVLQTADTIWHGTKGYQEYYMSAYSEGNEYYSSAVLNYIDTYSDFYTAEADYQTLLIGARTATEKGLMFSTNQKMVDGSPTVIVSASTFQAFIIELEASKEYFLNNYYNSFFDIYGTYKQFANMLIVFMAIKRYINSSFQLFDDIDNLDTRAIKNMFASYGIITLDEIPNDYAKIILKNIQHYFNSRGSYGVIEELFQIFDIDNLNLNRYLLAKTNKPNYTLPAYAIYTEAVLQTKTIAELTQIFKDRNSDGVYVSPDTYVEWLVGKIKVAFNVVMEGKTQSQLDTYFTAVLFPQLRNEAERLQKDYSISFEYKFDFLVNEFSNYLDTLLVNYTDINLRTKLKAIETAEGQSEREYLSFLKDLYVSKRLDAISQSQFNESLFEDYALAEQMSSIDQIANVLKRKFLETNQTFVDGDIVSLNKTIENTLEPVLNNELFPYPYGEIKGFLYEKLMSYYRGLADEMTSLAEMEILYTANGLTQYAEDQELVNSIFSGGGIILMNMRSLFVVRMSEKFIDPTGEISPYETSLSYQNPVNSPQLDNDVIPLREPFGGNHGNQSNGPQLPDGEGNSGNGMVVLQTPSLSNFEEEFFADFIPVINMDMYSSDVQIYYHLVNLDMEIDTPLTTANEALMDNLEISYGSWKLYMRAYSPDEDVIGSPVAEYLFNVYKGTLLVPTLNLLESSYTTPQPLSLELFSSSPSDAQILYKLTNGTGYLTYNSIVMLDYGTYQIEAKVVASGYKDSDIVTNTIVIERRITQEPTVVLNDIYSHGVAVSGGKHYYGGKIEVDISHPVSGVELRYVMGQPEDIANLAVNRNNTNLYDPAQPPTMYEGGNEYKLKVIAFREGYEPSSVYESPTIVVNGQIEAFDVVPDRPHYLGIDGNALDGYPVVRFLPSNRTLPDGTELELWSKHPHGSFIRRTTPLSVNVIQQNNWGSYLFKWKAVGEDRKWRDSSTITVVVDANSFTDTEGYVTDDVYDITYSIPDIVEIRMNSRAVSTNTYVGQQTARVVSTRENATIYYKVIPFSVAPPTQSSILGDPSILQTYSTYDEETEITLRESATISVVRFYEDGGPQYDVHHRSIIVKAPQPLITPSRVSHNGSVIVAMTNELAPNPKLSIHYNVTYDGSDPEIPTIDDTKYTAPITFTSDAKIRAKIIATNSDMISGRSKLVNYEVNSQIIGDGLEDIVATISAEMSTKLAAVEQYTQGKKTEIDSQFQAIADELTNAVATLRSKENEAVQTLQALDIIYTGNYLNSQYIESIKTALTENTVSYIDAYSTFLIDTYRELLIDFIEGDNEVTINQRLRTIGTVKTEIHTWLSNNYKLNYLNNFKIKSYTDKLTALAPVTDFPARHLTFSIDMTNEAFANALETDIGILLTLLIAESNTYSVQATGDLLEKTADYFNIETGVSGGTYPEVYNLREATKWGFMVEKLYATNPNPNDSKELFFIKIPFNDQNVENSIQNIKPSEFIKYDDFVKNDPFWLATEREMISKDFNYLRTKYIGINSEARNFDMGTNMSFLSNMLLFLKGVTPVSEEVYPPNGDFATGDGTGWYTYYLATMSYPADGADYRFKTYNTLANWTRACWMSPLTSFTAESGDKVTVTANIETTSGFSSTGVMGTAVLMQMYIASDRQGHAPVSEVEASYPAQVSAIATIVSGSNVSGTLDAGKATAWGTGRRTIVVEFELQEAVPTGYIMFALRIPDEYASSRGVTFHLDDVSSEVSSGLSIDFPVNDSNINFEVVNQVTTPLPVTLYDVLLGLRILTYHIMTESSDAITITLDDQVKSIISTTGSDFLSHNEQYDQDLSTGIFPKHLDTDDSVDTFDLIQIADTDYATLNDFISWFNNITAEKKRLELALLKVTKWEEYQAILTEYHARYKSASDNTIFSGYATYLAYMQGQVDYTEYTTFLFGTINDDGIDVAGDLAELVEHKKKRLIYLADLARDFIDDDEFDNMFQNPNLLNIFKEMLRKIINIFKSFNTDVIFDRDTMIMDNIRESHLKFTDEPTATEFMEFNEQLGQKQNNNNLVIVDDFEITDV